MKVLMITGDKNVLKPGTDAYARVQLQRTQVEELKIVYWGRGAVGIPDAGGFDVVTAQDPFWRGFVAWRAARKAGAKLQLQVHTDLFAAGNFRFHLAIFLLRKADTIRVVSATIKKNLESFHLHAPIFVLPIYIDVAGFKALIHLPHPRFKKTILWFGRFEPEKDPLYALEILKNVRAQGVDAGLIMLGSGSLKKELHQNAKELAPWVKIVPWQDPKPYLQMADVVVCTSRHESWGASMVEALAAGVPVVAPDVGIAREAGAIVVSRDKLSSAIVEALNSGARAELKIPLYSAQEWARAWKLTL